MAPPDAPPTIELPPSAPAAAPATPAAPPGPPAWTTDPAYAGVVAKVQPKFIRPTVQETLAAQAESYGELEKFKSKGAAPAEPKVEEAKPADIPAAVTPESTGLGIEAEDVADDDGGVEQLIQKAGLDKATLEKQWLEHGEFTPEQYAAFKTKTGRGKGEINVMAKGHAADLNEARAKFAQIRQAALDIVGGEATFRKIIAPVVAANMDPAELADLNEMLETKKAPIAMARIRQWYDDYTGTAGSGDIERGNGVAHAALPTTMAEFKALTARAMKGDRAAEAAVVAFKKHNSVASLK